MPTNPSGSRDRGGTNPALVGPIDLTDLALCSAAFVVDTAFPSTCSKDTRLVINLDEDEIMPAVTKMAMNFLDTCIQMDSGSKYLYLLLLVCDHDFADAGPLSWGL